MTKFIRDDVEESSTTELETPTKKTKLVRVKREQTTTPGPYVTGGSMNGMRGKVAEASAENGI